MLDDIIREKARLPGGGPQGRTIRKRGNGRTLFPMEKRVEKPGKDPEHWGKKSSQRSRAGKKIT